MGQRRQRRRYSDARPISELVEVSIASSTRVAYLDPFAFALEAPLAASVGYDRWRADLVERRRVWPLYGRFLEAQEPRLAAGGTYRCGMGLASTRSARTDCHGCSQPSMTRLSGNAWKPELVTWAWPARWSVGPSYTMPT